MNILYIGPNDSEWAQTNRPVGLAAAKWTRGFLTALAKACQLTALSHSYSYPWPKGNRIWGETDSKLFNAGWDSCAIGYPVLKFFRERYLSWAYPRVAKKIIRKKKIDLVIFYNCEYPHERRIIRSVAQIGTPCIPIILDGDDPRKDEWGWLKETAANSVGFVSLSWWVHQNITKHTGKPSYHMDGGAEGWAGVPPNPQLKGTAFTLVHTGALDQWRGLDFMIEVVRRLAAKRKDVKFVFTGKSSAEQLKEVFGDNPQVELPGFVSEVRMEEICNRADILLNVRDPKHPDNILNYPSKLPHYLSVGRPIVSTRLDSLSPDYAEVVHFPANDTVEAYLQEVERVLGFDDAQRLNEYEKIKSWFLRRKTWDVMVKSLVEWFEEIVRR